MSVSAIELGQLAEKVRNSFPAPDISDAYVRDHFEDLPLFSPSEFVQRLSAYLLLALAEWSAESSVCEFTLYGVSPDKDFLESSFWPERYALFSHAQVEIILQFLALAAEDEEFSFIYSQIRRAPDRIRQLTENVR